MYYFIHKIYIYNIVSPDFLKEKIKKQIFML